MASLSKRILNPSSIALLELLATRCAALFISEVGLDNSSLEGDFEIVINMLNKGELFNSSLGHLLKDTISLVSSLKSWSFSHTGRFGNSIANALIRGTRMSTPLLVRMEFVPPNIVNFIVVDLPASN